MLPLGDLRGEEHGLGQRGMRMDGEADVLGVRAHLEREHRFGDQLARIHADDRGAQERRCPCRTAAWSCPSSRPIASARPLAAHGNTAFVIDALAFAFGLGETHPRDLGIGVSHRWNGRASKYALCPAITSAAILPSWVALCASIGSPQMSPIAKMCGDVGAQLLVDRDVAALVDRHAGGLGLDLAAVGAAADRHQDVVVDLRPRRVFAFESGPSGRLAAPRVFATLVFSRIFS